MLLWPMTASWGTVRAWLLTAAYRMEAHAKRNEDLSQKMRSLLKAEVATLAKRAAELKTLGRALEDVEDEDLRKLRAAAFVTDAMCDGAQAEAWALLGNKQLVLAEAGTTRDAVFGASLRVIKNTSRERTIDFARAAARELRNLPTFAERDGLAAKLERRAGAHQEATDAIDATSSKIESDHRSPLGALLNQTRVEVVRLAGRLHDKLPRELVDALFPRTEREAQTRGPQDATSPGASASSSDAPTA